MVCIEKVAYGGWPNCYRLSNDQVDLVVTTDVGPRIIRFGFVGDLNAFKEFEGQLGQTGGGDWKSYGGHRFWHAPEAKPRTYYPDNHPVRFERHAGFVRVVQEVEPTTGIQKEIDLHLSAEQPHAQLIHRLRNANLWAIELAPWALSVMAPGGKAILPLPPRGAFPEHLLPSNTITLWPYTDMSDPRWHWGQKYIFLGQDGAATSPQKAGLMTTEGWAAYAREGCLFLKTFRLIPQGRYPDGGCCIEVFTDQHMLEIETLGPLVQLPPNGAVEHVEHWHLFAETPVPESESDVEKHISEKLTMGA